MATRRSKPFPFKLPRLDHEQHELLRHIADDADFVVTTNERKAEQHWLLVPVEDHMLHGLATIGAESEDLEDDEREFDYDEEPPLTHPRELLESRVHGMDQVRMARKLGLRRWNSAAAKRKFG